MKRILSFLLCICAYLVATAQDDAAKAMKSINEIKKNSKTYLYAESTTANWEDACDNAKELLEIYIEDWVREQKLSNNIDGCIAKAENNILEVKTKRGSLYRAFLYVKKSDILTYSSSEQLVVVPLSSEDSNASDSNANFQNDNSQNQPSPFENKILSVDSFAAIQNFINENDIANYGKYATMPSEGDCYLFVYNKEGKISAYLKRTSSCYINVSDDKADDINNYKGCGAIWFK